MDLSSEIFEIIMIGFTAGVVASIAVYFGNWAITAALSILKKIS